MRKETRIVHDYYYHDKHIFRLGYANSIKAHPPLDMHGHGSMMEFVYVEKGSQVYHTGGIDYTVSQGNVFFTRPYEIHNTGHHPEEISGIYFLIVDIALLKELGIFLTPEEYTSVLRLWENISHRVYKPSPSLHSALKRLMSCFDIRDLHFDSRIRNTLSEVMLALSTPQYATIGKQAGRVKRSLEYIHTHIDEMITVSALATVEHMSVSAFNKAFVKAKGATPGEYMLKCKIERAKELLSKTDLSVTDIAYKLGFSSSQYFATVFRRFCCTTPTKYRKG